MRAFGSSACCPFLSNHHYECAILETVAKLVWEGKYDANGKRVGPVRVALPFQTVETVNESAQERDRNLFSEEAPWRNRLIWGDKKYVLPSLLPEFAGKVNLIYIDPPFNTGGDFSFTAEVPGNDDGESRGASFVKQPSALEQKAYRDTWGRGLDSYVKWFYETAQILKDLLAVNGTIYVHLDYHVAHYAKCVMDEVFDEDSFVSEIIWKRTSSHNDPARPGNVHDVIFIYSRSKDRTWNPQHQSHDQDYIDKVYVYEDEKGRYRLGDLTAPGIRRGETGLEWRGVNPTSFGRHWRRPPNELEEVLQQGGIQLKVDGKPSINGWKQYLHLTRGNPLQSIWTDLPNVTGISGEKLRYPTQKPESLLNRIILSSSNEGDLVLDCFCGSGTTAAVAEKLGRRWITCDLGRFAVHTARKRLLAIPTVKPFEVQNLGRYERSAWQAAEFSDGYVARLEAYHRFILKLFKGDYRSGNAYIQGARKGRLVHVGAVDAPVTMADIQAVAKEARKLVGTGAGAPTELGIDVLFWDLAFDVNEGAKQLAESAGVNLRVYKIPNEVMEKKAVDQGDIQFHELAALGTASSMAGRTAKVELTDFLMSLDYVPDEVRQSVTHWSQWIDYWAVDWDSKGDAFHNQWQTYRTKKDPKLALKAEHHYDAPGEYRVRVKVIDLLGNDTTKTLKVVVK